MLGTGYFLKYGFLLFLVPCLREDEKIPGSLITCLITLQNLTYKIENFSSDLTREAITNTIKRALQMWSNVSQLTFTPVSTPKVEADINIRFVSGNHGDNYPTDGPGNELAHAFYPSDNKGLAGDVHFDDDETFAINGGPGVDLLWLAVHELGHSLGLEDSNNPKAVMYGYYTRYRPNLQLSRGDIKGIQKLYGKLHYIRCIVGQHTTLRFAFSLTKGKD